MTLLANAANYISSLGKYIGTWDKEWECCHPSVLDFGSDEMTAIGELAGVAVPSAFAGYAFYAAWTTAQACEHECQPDGAENVFLQRSNDRTSGWTGIRQMDTYGQCDGCDEWRTTADPALIYDPWNSQILAFWIRETAGSASNVDALVRQVITNPSGSDLSYGAITDVETSTGDIMSMSMVYEAEGHLHCWVVRHATLTNNRRQIWHAESVDNGLSWSAWTRCTVDVFHEQVQTDSQPWHLEARRNPYKTGVIDLVVSCLPSAGYSGMFLALATTTLSSPTVISTSTPDKLLGPGQSGAWDQGGIYKPSFQHYRSGNEIGYLLFYDGFPSAGDYWDRVGYTSGLLGMPIVETVNNREAGELTEGTQIELTPAIGSPVESIEYGWGETEPVEPSVYSGGLEAQEGTLWWRGLGTVSGDPLQEPWQSANYIVVPASALKRGDGLGAAIKRGDGTAVAVKKGDGSV